MGWPPFRFNDDEMANCSILSKRKGGGDGMAISPFYLKGKGNHDEMAISILSKGKGGGGGWATFPFYLKGKGGW